MNVLTFTLGKRFRVGAREDEERPGVAPVRDPLLRARDAPAVAFRYGARRERACVRARLGLGERECAEVLAAREGRHEARLLLLRPEVQQRQRDRACVHRYRDADACICARKLLQRQDVRHEVGARAAVLLRYARPHQAELRELDEEIAREPVLAVPRCCVRLDLRSREVTRERLHLFLLRRRLEVHEQDYIGGR